MMIRKLTTILAGLTMLFISMPLPALAINDVNVVNDTNFDLLTSDTAVPVTIVAAAGGRVTNFYVQTNYIDITLDNLSTVTFTAPAGSYLKITKVSGSDNYTVAPVCPTTTATLTGNGLQAVLRLQVQTTNPCIVPPPSGGGGGGGGSTPVTPVPTDPTDPTDPTEPTDPTIIPTPACLRTPTTFVPFTDIIDHWAETYIGILYRRCIVDGRTTMYFAPDSSTTRAELVKVVLNTYNLGTSPFEELFLDVFENDWYAKYITRSANLGVVIGYINEDGTSNFKPNQFITRAEALKVMLRTKGITNFTGYTADFADVHVGDWYYDYVAYAQARNILEGYTETVGESGIVRELYAFPYLLGPGSYNKEVTNLKTILTQLGYYTGTIDPAYDDELTEAVKNYQTANEITPTGYFGEYTRTSILNEILVPVEMTYFRPNADITRAEIAKVDVLVEQL